MADININNATSNAAYLSLVESLNEAAQAEGTTFEASAADSTLTITAKGADGVETKVQIPVPELDSPSAGPLDVGTLNTVVAKLNELSDAATLSPDQQQILGKFVQSLNSLSTSVSGTSGAASSRSILFDVYKIMALLQEVAQKQRDAAREIRQAENERIQASIQSQADAQREAAFLGMMLSACVCAVQVGISALGMVRQGMAAKQQSGMADTFGVNAANKSLQNAMEVSPRLTEARGNLAAVEADLQGGGVLDTVKAEFKTNFTASNAAEANLNVVEEGAVNAGEQVQQAKMLQGTATNAQAKANAAESVTHAKALEAQFDNRVQQQQGAYNQQFEADLTNMKTQGRAELQSLNDQKTALTAENQRLASPEGQNATRASLQAQKTSLLADRARLAGPTPAQQNAVAKIDAEIAQIDARLQQPNVNSAAIEANNAKIAALDQKIQTRSTVFAAKVKYAEAVRSVKQIEHSGDFKAVRSIGKASQNYETAMAMMKSDQSYIQATRMESRWMNIISINMAAGNMLNGITQNLTQVMQSEATRQGAETQAAQENLNMVKEIFDQAQKVIDGVRSLMLSILQTENQSISQIVQKV